MTAKKHSGSLLHSAMKLLFAVGGIYFSYILHDLVLERIYKSKYTVNGTEAKFTFACTSVFLVSLCCYGFASFVNVLIMKHKRSAIPLKEQFHVACLVSMSVIGGSMGLKYLSFHIQALLKSSKVLSVAILSLVKGVEKFTTLQIISAVLVTSGIVVFNLNDQKAASKKSQDTSMIGFFFVALSLLADGLVGAKQSEIRKVYKPNPMDFMQHCNKFITLISLVIGIVNGEAFEFYNFATENPGVIRDMLQVAFAATLGQCFIFYTVSTFGPFRLALITTTRKFITIIASIMIFEHRMVMEQWVCVFVIFFAIGLELYDSKNREKGKEAKGDVTQEHKEDKSHQQENNSHNKQNKVKHNENQETNGVSHRKTETETPNGEVKVPGKKNKLPAEEKENGKEGGSKKKNTQKAPAKDMSKKKVQ